MRTAVAILLVLLAAGCGGEDVPSYAYAPTKRCLQRETSATAVLEKEEVVAYAVPERLAPRSFAVFYEEDTILVVFAPDADTADEAARAVFETFERAGVPRDVFRRGNAFFFGPDGLTPRSKRLVERCLRAA